MSININSMESCREAWVNYKYENNTKGISDSDIAKIEAKYGSKLAKWKPENSTDLNEYEIEDDKPTSRGSSTSLALSGASFAAGTAITKTANQAAINGIVQGGGTFVNSAGQAVATPSGSAFATQNFRAYDPTNAAATEMAEKANNTAALGFIVDCTLGLANGLAYELRNPNEKEYDELMELEDQMSDYLSTLQEAEDVTQENTKAADDLAEEAEEVSEETEAEVETLQSEMDEKMARQDALATKVDSGAALTATEKTEYEELNNEISDLGKEITNINEESAEQIDDVADESETIQEDLAEVSESVVDIQDVADYAEKFDENTRNMCIIESVAQGLNVVTSTKGAVNAFTFANSGALLFGSTLWANAFGAMGVTGAALSLKGFVEQAKFASDITKEMKVRDDVQNLSKSATDAVEESSENLKTEVQAVENAGENLAVEDLPIADEQLEEPKVVDLQQEEKNIKDELEK